MTEPLPRMRIRNGRVMHLVDTAPSGDLRSLCTLPNRGNPVRRAWGPAEWWTADRAWYPDCEHCTAAADRAGRG